MGGWAVVMPPGGEVSGLGVELAGQGLPRQRLRELCPAPISWPGLVCELQGRLRQAWDCSD